MFKLLKVGNGTEEYPGNFTKKEIKIIQKNCKGTILNLFSGKSKIGLTIDYTYGMIKRDVFDWLKQYSNLNFETLYDTVIIDAPYNQRFADQYQKIGNTPKQFIIFADTERTTELFNYIDKINPEIIILKSWNYYCLKRYRIDQCYICYAGGYRKSTFLIVMKRKQETIEVFK